MRQALPSRAELPVRETDQWFRILAESTSTAIFVYAADRVLYVNPACMELTGYSSQELLAMEPGEIAAPEFQEMMRERAAARLRGEPVPKRYEVKILTKDGRERWFDFTSAVLDLGGRRAGRARLPPSTSPTASRGRSGCGRSSRGPRRPSAPTSSAPSSAISPAPSAWSTPSSPRWPTRP